MRRAIELEAKEGLLPRDRVWRAVLSLQSGFTVRSVQDACAPMVSYVVVHDYIGDLEKAGYVRTMECMGRTDRTARFTARKLELVRNQLDTPRVHHGNEGRQGLASLALWRAMKILASGFSAKDLAEAASFADLVVTKQMAELYARRLTAVGYLRPLRVPKAGRPTFWQLVRNTGPLPPAIKRDKRVFDRNTGEVIAVRAGGVS